MRGRPAFLSAVAGCALVAATLPGCRSDAPAELPDGVRVEVLQGRTDYTSGTVVIRVVNESNSDVELERARLAWPGFAGIALWERGTKVREGTTVDLRAPVPDVACDEEIGTSGPTADLTFLDGGHAVTVTAPVTDPLSTLDRLRTAGCIAQWVDRVATVSVGAPVLEGEGRASVAVLPLTFTPTGADGRVEILAVSSTPLLLPDPASYSNADDWPLRLRVDTASGAVTADLRIVPARCDAHAIADDKVGTVLNIAVSLPDGPSGNYPLVPPDHIRSALLNYVSATCGLL